MELGMEMGVGMEVVSGYLYSADSMEGVSTAQNIVRG